MTLHKTCLIKKEKGTKGQKDDQRKDTVNKTDPN